MLSKTSPLTVKASAALEAAGAYDTPTEVNVGDAKLLEIFVDYTRGAAGGAFKVKISALTAAGGSSYERTVEDGASLASGAMNVFTAEHKFPVAAGASLERRSYIVDVSTCRAVKIAFAEYGNTGTPGTLAATCILAV